MRIRERLFFQYHVTNDEEDRNKGTRTSNFFKMSHHNSTNYYQVLPASRLASCSEIKALFEQRAAFFLDTDCSDGYMEELKYAASILCNEDTRKVYDRKLEQIQADCNAKELVREVELLQRKRYVRAQMSENSTKGNK